MSINLLEKENLVETPFISVKIGDYSFGLFNRTKKEVISNSRSYTQIQTTYPNFLQSISVDRINGQVNRYTLKMCYVIQPGDDPNLLEKVFSSVSNTRKIVISYGDLSSPIVSYREESAIIQSVTTDFNIAGSRLTYTINAISDALLLSAGVFNFRRRFDKPSNVIREILYNSSYNLLSIFPGMKDKALVFQSNLIPSDDKAVEIEMQNNISIIDYLNYLINCMSSSNASNKEVAEIVKYALVIHDDYTNKFGGAYFEIKKISSQNKYTNSLTTYEVDIGYPTRDLVKSFDLRDNQTYSLLYNYSEQIKQPQYIYRINKNGEYESSFSPALSNTREMMKTTEADKTWWTNVTKFPINASLVLKGLIRPALLMTYIKINVYIYGQKHISSGLYIVNKRIDDVDASGFRTTLSLLRIGGDE